ncbi:DUF6377 domain-containing protein [Ferruginibacter lapsinanis]|uniref:DUF6377 domain-containing protein n=1 Tax=Ferruginibacter lapsinanis TaxID=563172 RepID=UPI001E47A5B9|nr:DUF6377 domain-containing protein [Ferruginibacter lapsinanis]UEG49080.1 DUF6377 domain-containing protein [Ferruginibacter lapsinanis]
MLKPILIGSIFLFFSVVCFSQSTANYSFTELDNTIENAAKYDKVITKSINDLQAKIRSLAKDDLLSEYELSHQLYNYYKVYKYDSAYEYACRCQRIAYKLNDPKKIAYSSITLSFTLLSSGLFKETADSLRVININGLDDSIKTEYYALRARYYYDLADYAKDNYYTLTYNKIGGNYLDSALALYPKTSFSYLYYKGLKDIRLGNMAEAKDNFTKLVASSGLSEHEFALTASTLSDIYIQSGSIDSAISLLINAAIADIKSSTKETSAMYNLAQLLYKKGDIKKASQFIEYAINDASFYGARQRKVQLIAILPLIEAEKINQVESQKKVLIGYSVVMTILLIAVIFLAYTVYKQVAKLKLAQKIISEAHQKEHEINQQLAETNKKLSEMHVKEQEINEALAESNDKLSDANHKLSEANKIKEEYIGYFFNANSEFFNRIERFKRSIEQKVMDRKLDEIKFLVNQINLRKEKEDLLKNFDKAFLKLFPHFVEEFNMLFKPEDRIQLKDGEILNTDLRIFALIRMGINDMGKISQILEYSVNTINTYKTKIKNKSIVQNDEFVDKIMQIESN